VARQAVKLPSHGLLHLRATIRRPFLEQQLASRSSHSFRLAIQLPGNSSSDVHLLWPYRLSIADLLDKGPLLRARVVLRRQMGQYWASSEILQDLFCWHHLMLSQRIVVRSVCVCITATELGNGPCRATKAPKDLRGLSATASRDARHVHL
jgi:hypothetical protein